MDIIYMLITIIVCLIILGFIAKLALEFIRIVFPFFVMGFATACVIGIGIWAYTLF